MWQETRGPRPGLLISPLVMAADRFEEWRRQERPLVMTIEREGTVPVTDEGRRTAASEELALAAGS